MRKHENDGPTILDGLGPRAKSYLVRMAPRAVAAVVAATQAAVAAAGKNEVPNGVSPCDSPMSGEEPGSQNQTGERGANAGCEDSAVELVAKRLKRPLE